MMIDDPQRYNSFEVVLGIGIVGCQLRVSALKHIQMMATSLTSVGTQIQVDFWLIP